MTTYRLSLDRSAPVAPPVLDEFQQSVVDHPGGPLLVLAGPGTGKTTTLVEAIVDRIERRGASPESVLALTFSRKAAEQLRDRVTARLGRTMATTLSSTFHSFAYGLVRRYSTAELYAAPLRLLSAPEQDVVLQELLAGNREDQLWPPALDAAVATRGFAREVQAVLARAREKGLDPLDLKALGEDSGAPELVAAARFMQQYQVILDDQSSIDYPELIYRAVLLAEQPAIRADLRARFGHVFVDEYQDTDPSQVRLLRALAGDGRDLTVVGDPDQSIYAFRGAEVRGILDFPRAFPQRDGSRADTVALRVTRRFGPRLLRLSRAVVSGLATTGSIDADTFEAFRHPEARSGSFGAGRADVLTFDTERAETEHVADLLRRAHLEDGVPWSEMAVLVRSGRTSIPRLRRALGAAGVPVEVASDDTPLVQEPAVLPLLDALRAVVDLDNDDPADLDHFGADRAEALLGSPVGGLDATEVRALARALRAREKRALAAAPPDAPTGRPGPWRGPPRSCSGAPCCTPRCSTGSVSAVPPRHWPSRRCCSAPGCSSTTAPRPRRCCGSSGPAPSGRAGSAGASTSAARPPAWPTGTWTRSVRSSRSPPGPRSSAATPAWSASWSRCAPSRSRPTPWPSAGCAVRRSGCSPPTGPRVSSGGSWWSRTSRTRAGPT